MIENKPTNVFIAFKKLLEEIETEIDLTNKVGSKAIEERDYEGANEAIRRSTQIIVLRDKLVVLRNEWETLTASEQNAEEEIIHAEPPNIERLQEEVMVYRAVQYRTITKRASHTGSNLLPIHLGSSSRSRWRRKSKRYS